MKTILDGLLVVCVMHLWRHSCQICPSLPKLSVHRLLRGDQGENRIASPRNAPEPLLGYLTRMLP